MSEQLNLLGNPPAPALSGAPAPPPPPAAGAALPLALVRAGTGVPAGQLEGERRRDVAVAGALVRRSRELAQLHAALVDVALSRTDRSVTADDATRLARTMPDMAKRDPRWVAAVWRAGGWQHTGVYVRSALPERHARPIPVWRWAGGDGA